jgi:hypothetical protein
MFTQCHKQHFPIGQQRHYPITSKENIQIHEYLNFESYLGYNNVTLGRPPTLDELIQDVPLSCPEQQSLSPPQISSLEARLAPQ